MHSPTQVIIILTEYRVIVLAAQADNFYISLLCTSTCMMVCNQAKITNVYVKWINRSIKFVAHYWANIASNKVTSLFVSFKY